MSDEAEEKAPGLVIVRRRGGGHDEGHHGAVWKIAYADFMTAMMAFFLVMWLINATDKETLTAVAHYFNPIKLSDNVTNPKGMHDMESGARGKQDAPGESRSEDGTSKGDPRAEPGPKAKHSEQELFSDPYGILAKLAALAAQEKGVQSPGQAEAVHSEGAAFRDPFDPEFKTVASEPAPETPPPVEGRSSEAAMPAAESAAGPRVVDARSGSANTAPYAAARPDPGTVPPSDPRQLVQHQEQRRSSTPEGALESEIRQALRDAKPGTVPNVEVRNTAEGLLISLTDEFDYGMFAIASAEPQPATILLMEKIAAILKTRTEPIVVRGHTDGRQFRTQTYDNWRLSSARAHMAYYMLVRGGITEKRFERIEGHADRKLKVAGEPEAAQNRRIEILLRKEHAS